MRLKLGISAVSLCLVASMILSGCSDGGSTGGGNAPSPAPGGSVEYPEPNQPDNPGGSADKKDDGNDAPNLSLYEPVDQKKMVSSFSDNFEFYIVLDYSTKSGENGRYVKFRGPYSHCTKGSSIGINIIPTWVDYVPEDYLKDSKSLISNYAWDCYDKKIVHVKNSKCSAPIESSKWEYRDDYKYICEIWGGNQIIEIQEASYKYNHNWNIESFDGWCKSEDVDTVIKQLDTWPGEVVVLDGCPFQKNLKPDPHSSSSGYYLYNGRVYFEYDN